MVRDIFGASEEEEGRGGGGWEGKEGKKGGSEEGGMDSRRACYRKEERTRARLALDIYMYIYTERGSMQGETSLGALPEHSKKI